MRVSIESISPHLDQLRSEIAELTAAFEAKHGAIQTSPIITACNRGARWNGALRSEINDPNRQQISKDNQIISQRYPDAPCLRALAEELGMSVNALTKRAAQLDVKRNIRAKVNNHPSSIRAAKRQQRAAKLLSTGKSVARVAEKLDISPRLVRLYRQQLEETQEAA